MRPRPATDRPRPATDRLRPATDRPRRAADQPRRAAARRRLTLTGVLAGVLLGPVGAPDAWAQTESLTIVAYNIRHGRGMDGRVDLERTARALAALDADVIALQEVDDRTERTGGVDQVRVLADLLGYEGLHGPHRPYQGGFYGNGVLTRLPVRAVRTRPIPPASGSALSVLEVEVDAGPAGPVSVVSVHLAGTPEERLAQADTVTRFALATGHPVILAGDFNGRPDGPVLARLRRDWSVLVKEGAAGTYPADAPDREIDFVMVRPAGRFAVERHSVSAEASASDHRPVVAVLRVRD